MNKKSKKTIGLGILSWNAHDTLRQSLQSYPADFLEFFDEKIIYFSDVSEQDKGIASAFGWAYAGGPNEGIFGGMKRLGENLTSDFIILLQNDNPLFENAQFSISHIQKAVELLERKQGDLARMRHRWKVGEGFADVTKYLKYYDPQHVAKDYIADDHGYPCLDSLPFKKMMRRLLKPHNAKRFQGRSVFIEENPEILYPSVIQKEDDFYIIDSSVIDFTDQCLLISREMWSNVFVPYVEKNPSSRTPNGFQAPEICINGPWWRNSHFKVLQGQGIFTHARYDGSFRPEHHTNQE